MLSSIRVIAIHSVLLISSISMADVLVPQPLPTIPGTPNLVVTGINDVGQISGYGFSGPSTSVGFIFGISTNLFRPIVVQGAPVTFVLGLNNQGCAVGGFGDSLFLSTLPFINCDGVSRTL